MNTAEFRVHIRENVVSPSYRGWGHFWKTTLTGFVGIAVCIWLMRDVTARELLTVPVILVYAILAEYLLHRGPMHHNWPYLASVYEHTTIHHRYFTYDEYGYDDPGDFAALLLPVTIIGVLFVGFYLPIGVLLYFFVSPNMAYLVVATALAYFLSYEWLHLAYHASEEALVSKLPTIRALRSHHRLHHDPALMSRYNFNITIPLFDWLFGTIYQGGPK